MKTAFNHAAGLVAVWVALLLMSTSGGYRWFSPDTLEGRAQGERLVWLVLAPIYRSPATDQPYPLAEYLVREGYWRPAKVESPRWYVTQHWNHQWKDGHGMFHRVLAWDADRYIDWTEANPESAAILWPLVLELLREMDRDYGPDAFVGLVHYARSADDWEQLRAFATTHAELTYAREVCPAAFATAFPPQEQ